MRVFMRNTSYVYDFINLCLDQDFSAATRSAADDAK